MIHLSTRMGRHLTSRWALILALLVIAAAGLCEAATLDPKALLDGDIIFQKSQSRQSEAIREATNSPWTHVVMLWRKNDVWMVYEASGSAVRLSTLESFIE